MQQVEKEGRSSANLNDWLTIYASLFVPQQQNLPFGVKK